MKLLLLLALALSLPALATNCGVGKDGGHGQGSPENPTLILTAVSSGAVLFRYLRIKSRA